ncbi:MAG: hypothetical protein I3273_06950 [Candidatus Moeniiplasma glomeromycotorum]|nr:hypothetical protein [Candidatus Moeniiplasma glomeromycotorum]MCE8168268.1 hypothetical protein [Candidatus Moeniiplasma glomeromycotorum]MCE8169824.1 hypothetical protein [Candidatus Moeniiplasma glomeromycotorum]
MKHTCWCYYCGEIHEEIKGGSTAGGCCDYGRNHSQTCSWKKPTEDFFNTLTSEESMVIKSFLAYFNSFKTIKEYLENNKDISKIDQTGFYHAGNSLSEQEKQIFNKLRSKYKNDREREKETKIAPSVN